MSEGLDLGPVRGQLFTGADVLGHKALGCCSYRPGGPEGRGWLWVLLWGQLELALLSLGCVLDHKATTAGKRLAASPVDQRAGL